MKKRQLIFLLGLVLLCIAVFGFWLSRPSDAPVLVFKGYEEATNGPTRTARFELRNTTKHPIYILNKWWPPGSPTDSYVKKPVHFEAGITNIGEAVYIRGRANMAMSPDPIEILPAQTNEIKIILPIGSGPEQIGMGYYTGRYKDKDDFFNNLIRAYVLPNASLKQKAWNRWNNFTRWLRNPKQHDLWCLEILQP